MIEIIIKKITLKSSFRACALGIFCILFGDWMYKIMYDEVKIQLNISKKEYLEKRDGIKPLKLQWRSKDTKKFKASYLYLKSSKLIDEKSELQYPFEYIKPNNIKSSK